VTAHRLEARVRSALEPHPAVDSVALAGSRSRAEETPLSDWDFKVETSDFETLAAALPQLVEPLDPLARQWDRLSPFPTYMLMLRGPVKVDLVFPDLPNEPQPPWVPSAETLAGIDDHFWDWVLWLASKERAGGREQLAREQRALMHEHLLGPLGVAQVPASAEDAARSYVEARGAWEQQLGATVDPSLGDEVLPALAP
jgi:hypothetical protein